jgi:hypothetical protein
MKQSLGSALASEERNFQKIKEKYLCVQGKNKNVQKRTFQE